MLNINIQYFGGRGSGGGARSGGGGGSAAGGGTDRVRSLMTQASEGRLSNSDFMGLNNMQRTTAMNRMPSGTRVDVRDGRQRGEFVKTPSGRWQRVSGTFTRSTADALFISRYVTRLKNRR